MGDFLHGGAILDEQGYNSTPKDLTEFMRIKINRVSPRSKALTADGQMRSPRPGKKLRVSQEKIDEEMS
jgi:hypothetical protein